MADSDQDKEDRQLPASERRLARAREEGQTARSRDAGHALVLGTGLAAAMVLGPGLGSSTRDLLRGALRFGRDQTRIAETMPLWFGTIAIDALIMLLPLLIVLALAAAIGGMLPGGPVWSTKPMSIQFNRLDPRNGLSRIFSRDGLVDIVKLLAIAAALIALSAWFTTGRIERFAALMVVPLPSALADTGGMFLHGAALLIGVLWLVAVVDVPLQWFRFRTNMMMTVQEARQELKESEGDPMVKGRIRSRQREMARARMLAAVPKADVVITNPSHFAVAIRYDEALLGAPRVIAKGADFMAAQIRETAKAAGVPLVSAPPLARALYAHVELDAEIPAALYAAVAQVLAYVFQLRRHVPGRGPMPTEPDDLEVPPDLDPGPAPASAEGDE